MGQSSATVIGRTIAKVIAFFINIVGIIIMTPFAIIGGIFSGVSRGNAMKKKAVALETLKFSDLEISTFVDPYNMSFLNVNQSLENIMSEEDEGQGNLELLSKEGRLIYLVSEYFLYMNHIYNGGIEGFLMSKSAVYSDELCLYLEYLGEDKLLHILQRVLKLFPQGKPSEDLDRKKEEINLVHINFIMARDYKSKSIAELFNGHTTYEEAVYCVQNGLRYGFSNFKKEIDEFIHNNDRYEINMKSLVKFYCKNVNKLAVSDQYINKFL